MSIESKIPDMIASLIVYDPMAALDLAFKLKDRHIYPLTQSERSEVIKYINEYITA